MRYALALLLLAACGSETPAPPPADVPCGGACGSGTTCVSGRCEAVDAGPTDTGAMPDLLDVQAADAPSDAPVDATPDVARDVETRCTPNTLAYCIRPKFGGSCLDLQTNPMHCGACNSPCPSAAPECVAGRCTVALDGGR